MIYWVNDDLLNVVGVGTISRLRHLYFQDTRFSYGGLLTRCLRGIKMSTTVPIPYVTHVSLTVEVSTESIRDFRISEKIFHT